ncbi:hypothetical protein IWW39_002315 [Coemansia spiralis]|uniref:Uncharacterized protein n=1 Tax=Coemansia spiralis TaxID=417178 RepID=A0A9W8L5C2_9FUNG|nr:hypothetical protein IWW39_002315 [Coemansia spiralis]
MTSTRIEPRDSGESSSASLAESVALYEDQYLLVTNKGITIRRYYFPFLSDRFVPWDQIEYVKTAKDLGVKWYEIKEWGSAWSNIWWNCAWRFFRDPFQDGLGLNGMEHVLRHNIVVKVADCRTLPGSCVRNPDEAMTEINRLMQQHHAHSD